MTGPLHTTPDTPSGPTPAPWTRLKGAPGRPHTHPWRNENRHVRWLPTQEAERAAEALAARQTLTPLIRWYAAPAADPVPFEMALTRLGVGPEPLPWPARCPVTR